MKFWGMREMSSIQLILGDNTAGNRPIGKRAQKGVREHST